MSAIFRNRYTTRHVIDDRAGWNPVQWAHVVLGVYVPTDSGRLPTIVGISMRYEVGPTFLNRLEVDNKHDLHLTTEKITVLEENQVRQLAGIGFVVLDDAIVQLLTNGKLVVT